MQLGLGWLQRVLWWWEQVHGSAVDVHGLGRHRVAYHQPLQGLETDLAGNYQRQSGQCGQMHDL